MNHYLLENFLINLYNLWVIIITFICVITIIDIPNEAIKLHKLHKLLFEKLPPENQEIVYITISFLEKLSLHNPNFKNVLHLFTNVFFTISQKNIFDLENLLLFIIENYQKSFQKVK